MFTISQLKEAHSSVKSGANFPAYIKSIKALGVKRYETFIYDGHTEFEGDNGYRTEWEAKYEMQQVADRSNAPLFVKQLKEHQQGQSDYLTFCRQCAENGVAKWIVSTVDMTCTYYSKQGEVLLVEEIPGV